MKKCIYKLVGLAAALTLAVGVMSASAAEASPHSFRDVPESAPYYEAVETAYEQGIVNGYSDELFGPEQLLTRAELCQTLARAYHVETGPLNDGSTDDDYWAGKAIVFLQSKGFISNEDPATPIHFNCRVTRAEAVDAIYKALSPLGLSLSVVGEVPDLADINAIPEQYKASVLNAYKAGLLKPVNKNGVRFFPQGYLSRGEMCQILANAEIDFSQLAERKSEAAVKTYKVSANGFTATNAPEQTVGIVTHSGRTLYSLNDVAALLNTTAEVKEGTSKFFFAGTYDTPKFNTPAKIVTVNGTDYEFCKSTVLKRNSDDNSCCILNSAAVDGNVPFIETETGLYVSGPILHYMTGRIFAKQDGTLNALVNSNTPYPSFIANSTNLTTSEKDLLRSALWLVYNVYPEGYTIVTTHTRKIKPASQAEMQTLAQTDDPVFAAADYNNIGLVWWKKGGLNYATPERAASTLVHEATHFQQHGLGDNTETVTTLNQGKTLYFAGQAGYSTDNLNHLLLYPQTSRYYTGSQSLSAWLEAQND